MRQCNIFHIENHHHLTNGTTTFGSIEASWTIGSNVFTIHCGTKSFSKIYISFFVVVQIDWTVELWLHTHTHAHLNRSKKLWIFVVYSCSNRLGSFGSSIDFDKKVLRFQYIPTLMGQNAYRHIDWVFDLEEEKKMTKKPSTPNTFSSGFGFRAKDKTNVSKS